MVSMRTTIVAVVKVLTHGQMGSEMTLMLKLVILAAVALNISLGTLAIELRIKDDGNPNMCSSRYLGEAGFDLAFSISEKWRHWNLGLQIQPRHRECRRHHDLCSFYRLALLYVCAIEF